MIQLNMIQLNILPLLVALNFFFDRKKKNVKARIFVEKWLDHMLLNDVICRCHSNRYCPPNLAKTCLKADTRTAT